MEQKICDYCKKPVGKDGMRDGILTLVRSGGKVFVLIGFGSIIHHFLRMHEDVDVCRECLRKQVKI